MNTFTADMAKELSNISNNNQSAIVNYIMYHAFLGHDFVVLTEEDLYYKDAINERNDLRKIALMYLSFLMELKLIGGKNNESNY